jgi:branched-chain amino acid transport system ATP-binding protein
VSEPDPVILRVEGVSLNFGNISAITDVSMEVRRGEILAIIGPNGAGKTCLLNCINGFYRPQFGKILFQGKDLTQIKPHRIARMGIARTFQNIELFTGLSTLDNLMAARHMLMKQGALSGGLFFGPARREEIQHRHRVEDVIDLLELEEIRKKIVGSLPYGQRKRVDLARSLCMEPEVLLMDEPMAGMNVEEKEDMARFILDIHELKGTTIVLVEHDMGVVMDIVQRAVVLDFGVKIAEGTPEEIEQNADVIRAYLGEEY